MTDDDFRSACNVFGFAPSRALRELLDTATAQAVIAEREACAKVCESRQTPGTGSAAILNGAADAIRARGQA